MEGIFSEFENENAIRSYPFATGCVQTEIAEYEIPPGVFVDASLYPVNPSGVLYLSSISESGVFSISDSSGVVMTGSASGRAVEMCDTSALKRHVGTLVASSCETLSEFAFRGYERSYSQENTAFASSCVFPVVIDGVVSLSVGGNDPAVGSISFLNKMDDDVRVSSGISGSRKTIRFDILPAPPARKVEQIRRVICVVDGETPFRIQKLFNPEDPDSYGYNTVILKLDGICREDVCSSAHREDSLEMFDTCECRPALPDEKQIQEAYQLEEVFIPPDEDGSEGGVKKGAENAFFLVVPNELGYGNPISITLEDGEVLPDTGGIEIVSNGRSVELAEEELSDRVTSKAVVIQVPGLGGGSV